jgi:hypothetical protein
VTGYIFFEIQKKNIIYKINDGFFSIACTLADLSFSIFRMVHFLVFASHSLVLLSPAAPAAGSAASGPAPAAAPGRGRPGLPLRASPLLLAATPPALLTSRVCAAALIESNRVVNVLESK